MQLHVRVRVFVCPPFPSPSSLRRELFTSYESHDDGLKTFDFIWEKFRGRDMTTLQRALFWLQDLTRLKVKIPYLPHMFEDALKGKKGGGGGGGGGKGLPHQKSAPLESGSSFDEEMEGGRGLWKRANVTHKDSTGRSAHIMFLS